MLELKKYNSLMKEEWNFFLLKAKNSTFLFNRDYMDYHSLRFEDASLMVYIDGKLKVLFPCAVDRTKWIATSHSGLTYGGFVLATDVTATELLEVLKATLKWFAGEYNIHKLYYKPLPHIYASIPSDEDLYALFKFNARLVSRGLSSAICAENRIDMRQLRKRGIKRCEKEGVEFAFSNDFATYWEILDDVLSKKHGCKPVHLLEEMELLVSRFPNDIKLYGAFKEGEMCAGIVVYETARVAHFQYIATSERGRETGALDGLFNYLIYTVYDDKPYIDFGISTENGGEILNEGLLFQKEGFGARGVVYDMYEIEM